MRWRVGVAVLVALAVGVGVGWAYATSQDSDDGPGRPVAAAVEPVPAEPTLPVELAQPDPDDPTLEPGIPLTEDVELQLPDPGDPPYAFYLSVPVGWKRGFDGESKWTFLKPGNSDKTFGLRVEIISGQDKSVEQAIRTRIAALNSAAAQGSLGDFEYQLLNTGDGFDSTFTDDGYDRVSLERFYEGPNGAFATVAVYGRVRDRDGLEDLISLITRDQYVAVADGS